LSWIYAFNGRQSPGKTCRRLPKSP
jgi:hypothetical protein